MNKGKAFYKQLAEECNKYLSTLNYLYKTPAWFLTRKLRRNRVLPNNPNRPYVKESK